MILNFDVLFQINWPRYKYASDSVCFGWHLLLGSTPWEYEVSGSNIWTISLPHRPLVLTFPSIHVQTAYLFCTFTHLKIHCLKKIFMNDLRNTTLKQHLYIVTFSWVFSVVFNGNCWLGSMLSVHCVFCLSGCLSSSLRQKPLKG